MTAPDRLSGAVVAAFIGIVATCLAVPILTRNLHFVGDDWQYLQLPYYNDLFDGLVGILHRKFRIGREAYILLNAKLAGMDRGIMHLASMTLHALNAVLFGAVLIRAFPARPDVAITAALLAATFPNLLAMTYVAYTDTARVPVTLFWLSVLAHQQWARGGGRIWLWGGIALFLAALTVYENVILFIAVSPLLLFPVMGAAGRSGRNLYRALAELAVALGVAGASFVLYRHVLEFGDFSRGPKGFPRLDEIADMVRGIAPYLMEPLRGEGVDAAGAGLGALLALVAGVALYSLSPRHTRAVPLVTQRWWYVAGVGLALLVAGITPYLLVGVGTGDVTVWNAEVRFLSSGAYGLCLAAAAIASHVPWRLARRAALAALVAVSGTWLAFGAGLRNDWSAAAERHCRLWQSLFERVPDVSDGTVLLIEGLRHPFGRVPVFEASDSLLVLVQMFYRPPGFPGKVLAYHLENRDISPPNTIVVTPEGVTTPLSRYHSPGPLPLDSLILVRREQDRLVVLDRIEPESGLAIDWRGIDSLVTRRDRIQPASAALGTVNERLARLSIRCST